MRWLPVTLKMRSRANSGWRRWYSTPRNRTKSKTPTVVGREFEQVDLLALDARAERAPREVKPLSCGPTAERVNGEHALRTAALRLERVEAVRGAYVQHALAVQPLREPQPSQDSPVRAPAGRDDTIPQVDRVAPANPCNRAPELVSRQILSL
jgi:hypothetical protein